MLQLGLAVLFAAAPLTAEDISIRDPFVLVDEASGAYYLFGTSTNLPPHTGFDCYRSEDLVHWSEPKPAFRPDEDFWSDRDYWAPEAHEYQGKYYLFASFNAEDRRRGTQILVADDPAGPYRPHSDGPVTPAEWECLDGTLYIDDAGSPWIVYCHEWVQIRDGAIVAQRLSEDLKTTEGEPHTLFSASESPWATEFGAGDRSGYVTDGPVLHRLESGELIMLWSSFTAKGYSVGVARSESGGILGPWTHDAEPLLAEDSGHCMLFEFKGKTLLSAHKPNDYDGAALVFYEFIAEEDGSFRARPYDPADAQATDE